MGVAARYDFSRQNGSQMQQGARFTTLITWAANSDGTSPFSLVGYQARMMLRTAKTAAGPPVLSIVSTGGSPTIHKGDGTTFGAAGHNDGTILIDVPDEATDPLNIAEGDSTFFYDLEVEDSAGNVERILEGLITITPQVTR